MRHPFERLVSAYENKVREEIYAFFCPEMRAVHWTGSFQTVFFNFQNCESMWHINRQTNVRKGVLFKYCPFPLVQGTTYFTRQNTMGQRCLNQVWAINSDCSARATCNKPFSGIPQLLTFHVTLQKAPKTWKFSCHVPAPETWHITKTWQVGHPWKRQFRKVYFKSLVHSSQKLWPKPD